MYGAYNDKPMSGVGGRYSDTFARQLLTECVLGGPVGWSDISGKQIKLRNMPDVEGWQTTVVGDFFRNFTSIDFYYTCISLSALRGSPRSLIL